jgi:peptidoglycan biosynthesis protein MviN/MurJ (putative lipid II flippase)
VIDDPWVQNGILFAGALAGGVIAGLVIRARRRRLGITPKTHWSMGAMMFGMSVVAVILGVLSLGNR